MEEKILGNPNGWYAAWESLVKFVGDYNPTPLHPNMVIFLITCLVVLGGCRWVWVTYLRPPKKTTVGGGH